LADTARIAKGGVMDAICRPDAPSGLSGAVRRISADKPAYLIYAICKAPIKEP